MRKYPKLRIVNPNDPCDKDEIVVVEDRLVDVSEGKDWFSGPGWGGVIQPNAYGSEPLELKGKAFCLNSRYDWIIATTPCGELRLVPLRKKTDC